MIRTWNIHRGDACVAAIRYLTAAVVALAAMAGVVPSRAQAHEGHDHKVMGTVASIQDEHIEVQALDGETTMFTVTEKTKILRGEMPAQLADIEIGERVVVIGAIEKTTEGGAHASGHDDMMTAREIRLGSP